MYAKEHTCRVVEVTWLTAAVLRLRFEPIKKFKFKPGQFVSVMVPSTESRESLKRCYSLASSPEESAKSGTYELCVKYQPHGAGSGYLASLRAGDLFDVAAAYGHFTYRPTDPGRRVMFISTGTGIAPFRSMALSEEFQDAAPETAVSLFGARTEDELLYRGEFEAAGVKEIHALSQGGSDWKGFHGRVTDYLASQTSWPWHLTDFYLCGNGDMVMDVVRLLKGMGVQDSAIYREAFSATTKAKAPAKVAEKTADANAAGLSLPLGLKQAL